MYNVDTLGAGRINKPANIAALIFFAVSMTLGYAGYLQVLVQHVPVFVGALIACFIVGYVGGTKLEMDRLFTLTCSLIWIASAVAAMNQHNTSVLVAAGFGIAFGTAGAGVSLYNYLVLGPMPNAMRQIALEDLQRDRERRLGS